MKAGTLRFVAGMVALASGGGPLAAQQASPTIPQPKIYAVQPAGGKAGSTLDLRIASGANLDGIDRLLFSHPGITAQIVKEEPSRLYPQGRILDDRFKIRIAADVPPGIYELRAAGYFGVTNARRFQVDDADQVAEKEPNNDPEKAQEPPQGAVLNGICDPQKFDYYKLAAKKGVRYLVRAEALLLDSRAQIVLTLIDPAGRELRQVSGSRSRDPLLDFSADTDGAYLVRVNDLLYRGGDDYFYRLRIGTDPWIDFIDPPVLKPGVDNAVTIYGRNLPGGTRAEGFEIDGRPLDKLAATIKPPAAPALPIETMLRPGDASADLFSWHLPKSNPVRLLVSEDAATVEAEPNDEPEKPQPITLPALIVGRFNPRGDRDWYQFEASKGDKLWIEIVSQRFGVPVDPQVVIQQAGPSSKDLQEVDDLATPLPPLPNNVEKRYGASSDDPALLFTVPADGKYRLLVRDQFGSAQGDPTLVYVLRVRAAKPDFRLVAFPVEASPADGKLSQVTCIVTRGGSDRFRVIAYRREGFDDPIVLEAEGLPTGLSARPTVIGTGDTSSDFVLKAAPDAPAFAGTIRLVGRSGKIVQPVRSAEVLWNVADMQKEAVVTRITDGLGIAVDDHFLSPLALKLGGPDEQRMSRAGKLKIPVKLIKQGDIKDLDKAQIKIVTSGLSTRNNKPISAKELTLSLAKPDGELELDLSERAPLGVQTFNLAGDIDVPYVQNPERLKKAQEEQKRIGGLATEIAAEAKKAGEQRAKADKEAQEAAAAVAKLKSAGKKEAELNEAQDKAKAADEAKAKAAEEEKKAQALSKEAEAAKKEWAEELKKATAASKEKKVKVWFSTYAVSLEVLPAPASLKPGTEPVVIKAGDKAEFQVEVLREFGFADEVKLELSGSSPVKLAQAVTVAGNAAKAPIVLTADKGTKPGPYTVTLRGSMKFNGKSLRTERELQVTVEAPPAPAPTPAPGQ